MHDDSQGGADNLRQAHQQYKQAMDANPNDSKGKLKVRYNRSQHHEELWEHSD